MSNIKILALIENVVYKQDLIAEHGLSMYIKTDTKKILFDTGQSPNFIVNARQMSVPLDEIDCVVISHGHFDHAGGLYAFLEINKTAKVYIKKSAFDAKFHDDGRFIGIEYNDEILKDRVVYVDSVIEIDKGLYLCPEIEISDTTDTHFKKLKKEVNGILVEDMFDDELFLSVHHEEYQSIVTACSHRGITNICNTALKLFNRPLDLVLGGYHLKEFTMPEYETIRNYFKSNKVKRLAMCHCTGLEIYSKFYVEGKIPVYYFATGVGMKI